jgi:FkbM family methyltransferase
MLFYEVAAKLWAITPPLLRRAYYRASADYSPASLFLPDRLETVEIMGGIGKGLKMHLNLRRERGYYLGIHELDVQSILSEILRPGMNVYNIGAHLGFFTLILIKLVGPQGRVVAFEPNPEGRKRLVEHLSLNGLNGRVRVEDYALGDFDGDARFSLSLSNTQGRFEDLPHVKGGSTINVHCKRLDKYVEEGGTIPAFVLMDVEHAEGRVLRGMFETIESHKPLIVIETHGPEAIEETWVELKKHQYELATIPDVRIVTALDMVRYGHYLAAHRSYFEQNL